MLHYLLPRLSKSLFTHMHLESDAYCSDAASRIRSSDNGCCASSVKLSDADSSPPYLLSHSLAYYLNDIKQSIQTYEDKWDTYKKFTNPYEYIHTIIPNKNVCVSKYKPLSRSYFKMIELINYFHLGVADDRAGSDADTASLSSSSTKTNTGIQSFHLAEGPGGFIEALVGTRKNRLDRYYGMTLLHNSGNNDDVPGWRKSKQFLRDHSNVIIENGYDQTGNILNIDNFLYVIKKYGNTMDIVTADGGFDFSTDFNKQEMNAADLIFAQIAYAVCLQKPGGCFVLKVFDIFTKFTVDMIALLSSMYQQVYVTKPNTSRFANSERYIVCKGFRMTSDVSFIPIIYNVFRDLLGRRASNNGDPLRLFSHNIIPCLFLTKLEEYNAIFGQQQIENIHYTIQLIHETETEMRTAAMLHPASDSRTTVDATHQPSSSKMRTAAMLHPASDSRTTVDATHQPSSSKMRTAAMLHPASDSRTTVDATHQPSNSKNDVKNETLKFSSRGMDQKPRKAPENRITIQNLVKKNIQKCSEWCVKHRISYEMML
jgi:FtsJ-like methyltransferase